jgi:cytochrome c biogenesis protein CcdA
MLLFLFALLAGAVTVAGPCILPLLPIILGTSTVRAHPARPLAIVLGFILSFSVFAVVFGVFGSILGISPEAFRWVAAIVISLFGLMMVFPRIQEAVFAKIGPLVGRVGPKADLASTGLWSGFLLGTSLGLVWSPCAGPILGSILTLVAAKRDLVQAGSLLLAYAIGAGLPMLLIAYGGQAAVGKVRAVSAHAAMIQRVFGVVIVVVGLAIGFGLDRSVQAWLVQASPGLFLNLSIGL